MRCMIFIVMVMLFMVAYAQGSGYKQYLPVDSDNDGVLDELDECYKTPKGTPVNAKGCPALGIDFATIQLNISFAYDSAEVEDAYFSEVERVATFLNQHPLTRAVLEAHTDSDGSEEYNQSLSECRAQAVAKLLVSQFGIESQRVTAVGYGESRPLVANDSNANKAKNRRVVAAIKTLK